LESERPDAIFHDPYARQLAGKRGEDVVRGVPRARASVWGIVTRTAVRESVRPAGSNPSAWICEITRNGALFTRMIRAAEQVLVVSEGFLLYLSADAVAAIACDLHMCDTFSC
jgi:O-methyltransferase involved in polyketide biosynthesis